MAMRLELSVNDEVLEALNRHLTAKAAGVRAGLLIPNIADEHVAYTVGAARAAGWKPEAERKRRGKK